MLAEADTGRILPLHREISACQLIPRNFVRHNPEEHGRIYRTLDASTLAEVVGRVSRLRS